MGTEQNFTVSQQDENIIRAREIPKSKSCLGQYEGCNSDVRDDDHKSLNIGNAYSNSRPWR
jgi:hypothetical protein